MMQQRERLYQLDKPSLARDAAATAAAQGPDIPPGWIKLDQCNLSPFQGQALMIPHVLLHPEIGVALVDIAPGETAGAEPAFRDRLEAARFAAIFPGQLPVVHLQLQPEELGSLDTLLPQSFATLPPLRLPGGDGWVSVVRRALASRGPLRDGPAEQARDRAMPQMLNREVAAQRAGLAPAMPEASPEPPRARWPGLPIALGLAGLTAVAVASVVAWTGSRPADPPVAAIPAPQRNAAAVPERSSASVTERSGAAIPERSGASAPAPVAATAGGRAPIVAPSLIPVAPPATAPARLPDAASTSPSRDRMAAAAPPRPPEASAAPAAPAAPPAGTAAAERTPRLSVRAAANIRTQPNNKATIIRTAPQGEVLREFSRSFDDWVEVGDTRPQGWMFGKYLVPVKP